MSATNRGGVTVVTGGNGGIGSAVVERLRREGHAVVAFDVEADADRQIDVTDAQAVRSALADVVGGGVLEAVVNCAGTAHRESFEETTIDSFMTDVRTNLLGTFVMCQAAVFPHMRRAARGRLVNIASISSERGGFGPVDPAGGGGRTGAGYAASKAGVVNLTRWIAREVGGWGIRCNAVSPGFVVTPMTAGHHYVLDDVPVGRPGQPADVADVVAWLIRPEADYIHGAVIPVDGGALRA